jgi:cytochrome b561
VILTRLKYGPVAMSLHWLIAALLLTNYVLAWLFNGHFIFWDIPGLHGPAKLSATQWHKSLGISILLLSVVRLIWRLTHRPPPLSPHLAAWEKGLAHLVHWGLYVFMIGMPLLGWALVSASKRIVVFPINMFGLFNWPALSFLTNQPADQQKATHHLLEFLHSDVFGTLGLALIALHVAGALKHHYMDRDNELARILPGLGEPGRRGIG